MRTLGFSLMPSVAAATATWAHARISMLRDVARLGAASIGRAAILLALALALGSVRLAAQVLNMSHDLVPLGIASQNLSPNNPSLDAAPLFQATLSYVQGHSMQTLTLDTGAYYLLTNQQSNAVLIFNTLSNLTIDLAGSTIYFNGPQFPNGLLLNYCSNLIMKNFQIDYVHLPYTHVQLTSVDTVNRLLKYQTLPNWPDPASFNTLTDPFSGGPIGGYWAAIFRNGSIVPGTSRTLLKAPFNNNTLTIQDTSPWAQSATLSTLRAADTIAVTTRGGGPPILVWEGNSITIANISIYGSATEAVVLYQTNNSTVDSVRIMPRPGSGLIGADGDGIHFRTVGQNNHIRNCYVTRTMDDGIVMESPYAATVFSQSSPRQLTVVRNSYVRFPNGTAVNLVDPGTTLESTGATIVAQDPPDAAQLAYSGQVNLTFDRDLPSLAPGTIMAFGAPAQRGEGSTIEDNLVEDTYGGRGIWISGAQGITIQRNVMRRTSMGGIDLQQETDAAVDPGDLGPPTHEITITDNALEAVLGPAACGTGLSDCLGAVQVVSTNNQSFGFASSAGNTNITIANNYIADSGRSGIWLGEVDGGTLQNNLVIRSSQNPTLGTSITDPAVGIPVPLKSQVAQDALTPVVIRYSSSVVETGDTVSATSNITAPVTMTPPSATAYAAATTGSFTLQTAVSGFAWKAASDSPWLITSATGAGSATVPFSVTANGTGAPRTGHITIAGESFTVTQTTQTAVWQCSPLRFLDPHW